MNDQTLRMCQMQRLGKQFMGVDVTEYAAMLWPHGVGYHRIDLRQRRQYFAAVPMPQFSVADDDLLGIHPVLRFDFAHAICFDVIHCRVLSEHGTSCACFTRGSLGQQP